MREKKTINIAIGRRIQQSREQAGLTQEELAERIDRSTQFISTIERGLAGPSLETVLHLCEVLGTSTEWILRGRRRSRSRTCWPCPSWKSSPPSPPPSCSSTTR